MNKIKFVVLVLITCLGYWLIDSFISLVTHEYNLRSLMFNSPVSFLDPFILRVPPYQIISRLLISTVIVLSFYFISKYIKKISNSELLFRTAFETIPDGFAINRKSDGSYVHVNQGYLRLSGYAFEELEDKTSLEVGLWEDKKDRDRLIKLLEEKGNISDFELKFKTKRNEIRHGLMSAALITLNKELCTLTITKDISDRITREKELSEKEKQIRKASKMEAVGTLAGGVAHDFNNIIQIISGNVQLLLTTADSKDIKQKLSIIYEATMRGAGLSRRLLTFSRNVEFQLQPMDVNSEIILSHKLLDRTISGPVMININLDLDNDLDLALADSVQLNQVITNLCINAKDAMPNGGRIVITTRNVELDSNYSKFHHGVSPGNYVRLSIADNGEGMNKETQERIFEPFFTTKPQGKGTGLGLAVVYGIIKNHHGHIMVYSTPGSGTEFKIFIPALSKKENKSQSIVHNTPLVGGNEVILIIDDEDEIKQIGREILQNYGYKVLTADNGQDGLTVYKNNINYIDLIILDLIMPGMSGREVLIEIIKIRKDAKVIVASGYSANGPVHDALGKGAKRLIDKPYTLKQLIINVREVLDEED